ncbi:hypothetical protein N9165_02185 [Akkermansiaceae bacterium]|nr:hypothetical protein [Akkermansiaceae bacterium]MDB4508069.1 hypothetical protein [Akkermansiaceae bacterium]
MSKITPRRGTNFIIIKVGSHEQEEAKLLSGALTDAYVTRKKQKRRISEGRCPKKRFYKKLNSF